MHGSRGACFSKGDQITSDMSTSGVPISLVIWGWGAQKSGGAHFTATPGLDARVNGIFVIKFANFVLEI